MKNQMFKVGDKVVYPSHKSIGTVLSISEEEVGGKKVNLYRISFQKDNMVLHIPVDTVLKSGLRILNSKEYISKDVIPVLFVASERKDEAWRSCSSEYEAKLNSGDLVLIAEIVRDLCVEGNFTYSKLNVYEAALDRLVSEVSSVYNISYERAKKRLLMIKKGLARSIEEANSDDVETEKVKEKVF